MSIFFLNLYLNIFDILTLVVYSAMQREGVNMTNAKPKRKTRTSNEVKRRYNEKTYDRLQLVVQKGKKDAIRDFAVSRGESLNGFVNRAIDETMERGNSKGDEVNAASI